MRISRRAGIVASVLTAAVTGVVFTGPTASAVDSTGAFRGLAGKCLDVPGGNTSNGAPVQIWGCN
ncbi:chitinase, partial [Streptomyces sp. NPDC002537]